MAQLFLGLLLLCCVAVPAMTSIPFAIMEVIKILAMHNELRGKEGAADMKSMSILSSMTTKAETWLSNCKLDAALPSPPSGKTSINKNVYEFTSASAVNLTEAVYSWYSQKSAYNYDAHACTINQPCMDYLQMVSADTAVMGCAIKDCSSTGNLGVVLACLYSEGLNLAQRPFQKGSQCSKCSSGIFLCKNGLCRNSCPSSMNCKCKAKCGSCGVESNHCKCKCLGDYTGIQCSVGTSCVSETTRAAAKLEVTTEAANIKTTAKAAEKAVATTEAANMETTVKTADKAISSTEVANEEATTKTAEVETSPAGKVEESTPAESNAKINNNLETTQASDVTTVDAYSNKVTENSATEEATTERVNDLKQQEDTTTAPSDVTTKNLDAQCASFNCQNGGQPYFRIRKKRQDKCWCKCTAEYQGRRCKKSRKEAENGVMISSNADITLFDILWNFLKLIIMFSVNNFCRNNVDVCCPGSTNPVSRIPNSVDYITVNDITVGAGYPDNVDVLLEILFFIEAKPDNALCTYASNNGKRKKRQAASTSIILPQAILQNVVSSASSNITAVLADCCNATLSGIQPGQVDNTTEILTTAAPTTVASTSGIGTFLLAVIIGVVAIILVLVVVFVILIVKSYSKEVAYESKSQQYYRYTEPQPRIVRKPYIYGGYANYTYSGPSIYDVRGGVY